MSIETLQTLAEQYRAQIEALQKENKRLNEKIKVAENLFKEILKDAEKFNK